MTREEFIDGYVKRSNIERSRTESGFKIGQWERVALPCACGDPLCEGWAMVSSEPEDVELHNRLYAPAEGK